ncbi:MAG UNVERIFIED_CONTAM: hypothetical protein LVR18_22085 [Planctomycetaceae bacterium]
MIATGETGIASVFSSAGNLKVLPGGEIDTVQFTRGIDLRAGQTLRLPKFWTAPDLISYRGTELIFDDLTLDGTGGNVDGRMLPETLVSAKIVLEQRNGLVLDHTTTIDTEWLELNSDGNISVSGLESLRATTLIIHARGLREVLSDVYDPDTAGTRQEMQQAGSISIEAGLVNAEQWDIRAKRSILFEFSTADTDAMTIRGHVGGMTNGVRAERFTLRMPDRKVRLDDAIIEATNVNLLGLGVTSDRATEVRAAVINAEAQLDMRLYVASGDVTALSTVKGSVYLQSTGEITLRRILRRTARLSFEPSEISSRWTLCSEQMPSTRTFV